MFGSVKRHPKTLFPHKSMKRHSSLSEQFEKAPTLIYATAQDAAKELALEVRDLILARQKEGKNAVLGLATGSTPVPFYRELVRMHEEEGLSFHNVITFNLDEYYGLERSHPESYWYFMHKQLFNSVNIPEENIHLPDGTVPMAKVFEHCDAYEQAILAAGGVDLQILGIGRTGHIGFNEPGSSKDSRTRLISLDHVTRADAAADFQGEENVPQFAITMGVGSILQARKVVLMAWGENKAEVVRQAVEGPETDQVSASFLQSHPDARFLLNKSAATQLTRVKLPWLVGNVEWTQNDARRAVGWLSGKLGKPILKLVSEDYNENGMANLVASVGSAYDLNIRVFNLQQHTISGWPGGKAESTESHRPVPRDPARKTVLILAPEPQDEVVGMGGTIERLISQFHTVHIVYQTSGDLRVTDAEAERFAQVLLDTARSVGGWSEQETYANNILSELERKGPFGIPEDTLRSLKTLIRRGEARDAAAVLKVRSTRFLDAEFYRTGRYREFTLPESDIQATQALLEELKPNLIFTTGNLADPSSVQGTAFRAFRLAWERISAPWKEQCGVWLFRGQQKEYEPHEIEMAVPMSPDQLNLKLAAKRRYQSQIVGTEQVRQQNKLSATLYDKLGMAEYEAIEAFARWNG